MDHFVVGQVLLLSTKCFLGMLLAVRTDAKTSPRETESETAKIDRNRTAGKAKETIQVLIRMIPSLATD